MQTNEKRTEKEIIKWIKLVCRFCQKTFLFRCVRYKMYTDGGEKKKKRQEKRSW